MINPEQPIDLLAEIRDAIHELNNQVACVGGELDQIRELLAEVIEPAQTGQNYHRPGYIRFKE